MHASNPEGVAAAAEAIREKVLAVDTLVRDQQASLHSLSQSWAGGAAQSAMNRGRRDIQQQNAFRSHLDVLRTAMSSGGRQLSALREQILSTATQAASLGGSVGDDGSVRPSGTGLLITASVAKAYSAVLKKLLTTFDAVDRATASALQSGQSDPTIQAVDFVVGEEPSLSPPNVDVAAEERRRNEIDAFEKVFGHGPRTATDWQTAAALDPHSYDDKYEGVPPSIGVGRIDPVPGQGVVKTGLFIPRDEVFNIPRDDLGDARGFDPDFGPEDTRVSLYIDYENGVVIARQNPSVDDAGNVAVLTPDIRVQQASDGAVRIQYDAKNAFAPPGSDLTGHVVQGDIVVSPGLSGQPATVDGVVGDYPSLEVYQNMPDGTVRTLAQDAADSGNSLGPLTELPFSHEIGNGPAALEPFESYAPQLPGGPRYPGDTVPYVPGQIDPNTPTPLGPADKVPHVVVVR